MFHSNLWIIQRQAHEFRFGVNERIPRQAPTQARVLNAKIILGTAKPKMLSGHEISRRPTSDYLTGLSPLVMMSNVVRIRASGDTEFGRIAS